MDTTLSDVRLILLTSSMLRSRVFFGFFSQSTRMNAMLLDFHHSSHFARMPRSPIFSPNSKHVWCWCYALRHTASMPLAVAYITEAYASWSGMCRWRSWRRSELEGHRVSTPTEVAYVTRSATQLEVQCATWSGIRNWKWHATWSGMKLQNQNPPFVNSFVHICSLIQ